MTQSDDAATASADRVTVDPSELGKFAAMAERWWDPEGEMKPLHALNPTRIGYIRDRLTAHLGAGPEPMRPLAGMRLLDVGCGAGLLAEPLARLGADVTGIDAGGETITAAKAHAERQGLAIDYRHTTAEALAAREAGRYDAVLAMEIVEHVADVPAFLEACGALVRPGGAMVVATVNRTTKSWLLAKVGAEYVLRWLPPGTHDWRRFVRPSEIANPLRAAELTTRDVTGVTFAPMSGSWKLSSDTAVNYMLFATKAG